jgi:protein involved in polysaccharide export with SLBB domain
MERVETLMTVMKTVPALAVMLTLMVAVAQPLSGQSPDVARAAAVPPVTDLDDGAYRLNPGDTIEIKFMTNPELNELVQIRPDGRISMPLVGELLVAGTTIPDLSIRLSTAYADVLRTPSAIIQVREFANRRVFVGGEVNRPGMLPLVGRQTALSAVMEAGGFRGSAARDEIVVIRKGDEDEPRVLRLAANSHKGRSPEAANFALQPLDVVLVTESGVARTNRALDQYVRQMLPINLTGGFSWLLGRGVFGGGD